jgi:hypothetical protein
MQCVELLLENPEYFMKSNGVYPVQPIKKNRLGIRHLFFPTHTVIISSFVQGLYAGAEAQQQAEQRRLESKGRPKKDNTPLMTTGKKWFKKDDSPDPIAGRLKMAYREPGEMQESPETI